MSDATGAPSPAETPFSTIAPRPPDTSTSPTHWYKDAVIYQVHVRGFFDSNDDGVGDFAGLTRKLDYIQSLGVTCDLAAAVLPVAAPRRRLRHRALRRRSSELRHAEGFPRVPRRGACARAACHHRAGHQPHLRSASVVPGGAPGARRIVASATSTSGATPIRSTRACGSSSRTPSDRTGRGIRWPAQYYWHRFFHHQPDLNFDNPQVRKAVTRVMRFWLDMGVDGMRLDAVPYLIEREGTQCANLPETHDVLPRAAARDGRALSATACCSPKRISGRRTCARTSATATSATWRFTSR